jgi:hypothetical protein
MAGKPRGKPFAKGSVPNPNGRPPKGMPPVERARRRNQIADIRQMARGEGTNCIDFLIKVRDNAKAPHAVRVAAANALLDRGFGRPPQALEIYDVGGINEAVQHEAALELLESSFVRLETRLLEEGSPKVVN